MQQTVIDPHESDQVEDTEFDDIEWELCSSAREASFEFVPFANLDLLQLVTKVGRTKGAPQTPQDTQPSTLARGQDDRDQRD